MENPKEEPMSESMNDVSERAMNYFRQGLNCAECVMRSYMDTNEFGLPQEIIALASGYGGGMGETKNSCGAINGAMLVLGLKKGRRNPFEKETPQERTEELQIVYQPFGEMVTEIQNHYGTLLCRELTQPFSDWHSKERRKFCQKLIGFCAAIATKYAVD